MTFEPSGQSSSHSHRLRSAPLSVQAQTRQIPRAYCCCSRGLVPNPTRPSQSGHEIPVAAPSYASISQASRLCFRPPAFHWQQRSNSTAQHRIAEQAKYAIIQPYQQITYLPSTNTERSYNPQLDTAPGPISRPSSRPLLLATLPTSNPLRQTQLDTKETTHGGVVSDPTRCVPPSVVTRRSSACCTLPAGPRATHRQPALRNPLPPCILSRRPPSPPGVPNHTHLPIHAPAISSCAVSICLLVLPSWARLSSSVSPHPSASPQLYAIPKYQRPNPLSWIVKPFFFSFFFSSYFFVIALDTVEL